MAPVRNARVLYAALPTGYVDPAVHVSYDDSQTIDLDEVELDGGFLVKTLVLSIDPYMRDKMRDPDRKSYTPAYELGQSLYGFGVGVVYRSGNQSFKVGDHVYSNVLRHEEYALYHNQDEFLVLPEAGMPWSLYVGVLGMPGQTAYYSWKEFAKPKKGETAFVTTAGGAVGSFVVQLAKQDGLKVIASSGSEAKAEFARECGADVSFNYKTENVFDVLKREGGIDIFYDNVGGEHLDAALLHSHRLCRFIECGMSSTYNCNNHYLPRNLMCIISNEISVHGMLYHSLAHKYKDEFYDVVPKLVKENKIKFREDISYGLEHVGQAFVDVGTGGNRGKKVIIVAED